MKQHIFGFGLALSIVLAFVFIFSIFQFNSLTADDCCRYPGPIPVSEPQPSDIIQAAANRRSGVIELEYSFGKDSIPADRTVYFHFYTEDRGKLRLVGTEMADLNSALRSDGSARGIRRINGDFLSGLERGRNVYVIPRSAVMQNSFAFDRSRATAILIDEGK